VGFELGGAVSRLVGTLVGEDIGAGVGDRVGIGVAEDTGDLVGSRVGDPVCSCAFGAACNDTTSPQTAFRPNAMTM